MFPSSIIFKIFWGSWKFVPEVSPWLARRWKFQTFAFLDFFIHYLDAPQPTLGHYLGDSLTHLIIITAFDRFWPKGHQKSCNKVGFLSLTKHLVGFEPGTFQFLLQRLNPLQKLPFQSLSCTPLPCHLCHLFCYQVVFMLGYIKANIALILKWQKIVFQSFLVRLEENFLEFYLLLTGLFFLDGKDRQKIFDNSQFFSQ